MMKQLRKVSILILFFFCLVGCSGKGELGQGMIAQAMAVDMDDKGNIIVGFQVFNPSELSADGATNRPEVLTYEVEVKQGEEVDSVVMSELPGNLVLSHVKSIIYGTKATQRNFNQLIDKIIRLNQVSPQAKIFISKDIPAVDLLKVLTSAQKVPAQELNQLNSNAYKGNSMSVEVTPYDAAEIISTEGEELILPAISLKGPKDGARSLEKLHTIVPPVKFVLDGIAVFKGANFIGFLPSITAIYKNILTGKATSYFAGVKCKKNEKKYNQYELTNLKTKIKSTINKNGQVHFNIQTTGNANISYEGCKMNFTKKSMMEMEKEIEGYLKKEMKEEIHRVQNELGSDIFGLGILVHKEHKKEFKDISKNWNEVFKKATFSIKTDITVSKVGVIKETLKIEEENE